MSSSVTLLWLVSECFSLGSSPSMEEKWVQNLRVTLFLQVHTRLRHFLEPHVEGTAVRKPACLHGLPTQSPRPTVGPYRCAESGTRGCMGPTASTP